MENVKIIQLISVKILSYIQKVVKFYPNFDKGKLRPFILYVKKNKKVIIKKAMLYAELKELWHKRYYIVFHFILVISFLNIISIL